tara:strand:+ start:1284 stop:1640 length:357 start_codon:yes stop_codon:yes gene_type:complete
MTWFDIIKNLTPEERRQTYDFWPKEIRDERSFMNQKRGVTTGMRNWPKEKKAAYKRLVIRHKKQGLPKPTLEEVEEEFKNPIYIKPEDKQFPNRGQAKGIYGKNLKEIYGEDYDKSKE